MARGQGNELFPTGSEERIVSDQERATCSRLEPRKRSRTSLRSCIQDLELQPKVRAPVFKSVNKRDGLRDW